MEGVVACRQQRSPVIARAGFGENRSWRWHFVVFLFCFVLLCFYYSALTTANEQTAGALLARAKQK